MQSSIKLVQEFEKNLARQKERKALEAQKLAQMNNRNNRDDAVTTT